MLATKCGTVSPSAPQLRDLKHGAFITLPFLKETRRVTALQKTAVSLACNLKSNILVAPLSLRPKGTVFVRNCFLIKACKPKKTRGDGGNCTAKYCARCAFDSCGTRGTPSLQVDPREGVGLASAVLLLLAARGCSCHIYHSRDANSDGADGHLRTILCSLAPPKYVCKQQVQEIPAVREKYSTERCSPKRCSRTTVRTSPPFFCRLT